MKVVKWKPDFEKWYNVDLKSYEFIFNQAEKKHEEVLSESESITNKSIKILSSLIALLSFFIGFLIKSEIEMNYWIVLFILFSMINISLYVYLVFPKKIKGRGFSPKDLLPEKLDSEEDKGFQEHLLFYTAILKIQDNIDSVRQKNKDRASIYFMSILLSMILFFIGLIVITISLL